MNIQQTLWNTLTLLGVMAEDVRNRTLRTVEGGGARIP